MLSFCINIEAFMSLKSTLFASALALSACSTSTENTKKAVPVVNIAQRGGNLQLLSVQTKWSHASDKDKGKIENNPVIDEQQNLWECIIKTDPTLINNCMDQIAASANCYNAGVEKIVDRFPQIPACHEARYARNKKQDQNNIYDEAAASSACLDLIQSLQPDILQRLNPCFDEEISCLRDEIRKSSIVCTVAQEETY